MKLGSIANSGAYIQVCNLYVIFQAHPPNDFPDVIGVIVI